MRLKVSVASFLIFSILGLILYLRNPTSESQAELTFMTVQGSSMSPVLNPGNVIEVEKNVSIESLRRGDMVVFRNPVEPSQTLVKKVVALPGDRLNTRDDFLFVNDLVVKNSVGEKYVLVPADLKAAIQLKPLVSHNSIFVLGERPFGTMDSFIYFYLNKDQILGRVR